MTPFTLAVKSLPFLLVVLGNEFRREPFELTIPKNYFLEPENAEVFLVTSTGEEDVESIFQKAQCTKCHRIPGIRQANGKIGPQLIMGTVAPKRLKDPLYKVLHDPRENTSWNQFLTTIYL